jgi:hypothetical protein
MMHSPSCFLAHRSSLLTGLLFILCALILLWQSPQAVAQTQWTTSSSDLYNTGGGNVGVGTTTPSTGRLHITGNNSTSGGFPLIKLENTQGGVSKAFWLYAGANGMDNDFGIYNAFTGIYGLYLKGNSNAGFGTTDPAAKLHIMSTTEPLRIGYNSTNYATFVVGSTGNLLITPTSGYTFISGLRFNPTDALVNQIYQSNLNTTLGLTANGGDISFGQTSTQQLIVKPSGNVGIGTTTPGYKLDVNGSVNATNIYQNGAPLSSSQWTTSGSSISYNSGNVGIGGAAATDKKLKVVGDVEVTGVIYANYQDMAEWVPSTREIPAATVVVLDVTKSNQVLPSTQAYDTRVAGVVSAQPGIALGERGEGKVLVATTGRVKVKVDATRAPIHVGDLLVTGDSEGVAIKSVPLKVGDAELHRPGTIIGKALEPLEKGTGEILVLLSLQ